jgi:hypothetical protein
MNVLGVLWCVVKLKIYMTSRVEVGPVYRRFGGRNPYGVTLVLKARGDLWVWIWAGNNAKKGQE